MKANSARKEMTSPYSFGKAYLSGRQTRRLFTARLNRLRKNSGPGRKDVPQGLKPDVFSIIYGTTKVVPLEFLHLPG